MAQKPGENKGPESFSKEAEDKIAAAEARAAAAEAETAKVRKQAEAQGGILQDVRETGSSAKIELVTVQARESYSFSGKFGSGKGVCLARGFSLEAGDVVRMPKWLFASLSAKHPDKFNEEDAIEGKVIHSMRFDEKTGKRSAHTETIDPKDLLKSIQTVGLPYTK